MAWCSAVQRVTSDFPSTQLTSLAAPAAQVNHRSNSPEQSWQGVVRSPAHVVASSQSPATLVAQSCLDLSLGHFAPSLAVQS